MDIKVLGRCDARVRALLGCGLLLCGIILCAFAYGTQGARASGTTSNRPNPSTPSARASKIEVVNQNLVFEITQIKGNVIYAVGNSLGTFSGKASLHLRLVNASVAVAQIYASNTHGEIRGTGVAHYHASGAVSNFEGGSPPNLHGSGKYADLRVVSMKLTGFMNRRTLKIVFHLRGKWNV
jgi:hypothetical protein